MNSYSVSVDRYESVATAQIGIFYEDIGGIGMTDQQLLPGQVEYEPLVFDRAHNYQPRDIRFACSHSTSPALIAPINICLPGEDRW